MISIATTAKKNISHLDEKNQQKQQHQNIFQLIQTIRKNCKENKNLTQNIFFIYFVVLIQLPLLQQYIVLLIKVKN